MVREHVEFQGCLNGFNGAGVKAEVDFIYSNLEQGGKAARVHWRDKDRATQRHRKLTQCDDKWKKGTLLTNQIVITMNVYF